MTNKTTTLTAILLAASLLLACASTQATPLQCTCSATMSNLTVARDARASPALDAAQLRYRSPGKCEAEVSSDGNQINGYFRSKVEIRPLHAKKSSIENDTIWFDYDKAEGASLRTNYVAVDKDAADKMHYEKQGQTLRLKVIEDIRYAPSAGTVPYTLRKDGSFTIMLTCPKSGRN